MRNKLDFENQVGSKNSYMEKIKIENPENTLSIYSTLDLEKWFIVDEKSFLGLSIRNARIHLKRPDHVF
jgi:hypothetical protein